MLERGDNKKNLRSGALLGYNPSRMTRRGTELLDLPTLATSKEGRTAVWLKVSNDTERVWLTARHEVIVEVKVGNGWSVADRYHL